MPSGYIILNINVLNPENYKEYLEKAPPTAQMFGGEYIIRGGENEVIEGEWKYPRTVVIKFPSYEKVFEWYNSEIYKPIRQIRLDNTISFHIILRYMILCLTLIIQYHKLYHITLPYTMSLCVLGNRQVPRSPRGAR